MGGIPGPSNSESERRDDKGTQTYGFCVAAILHGTGLPRYVLPRPFLCPALGHLVPSQESMLPSALGWTWLLIPELEETLREMTVIRVC